MFYVENEIFAGENFWLLKKVLIQILNQSADGFVCSIIEPIKMKHSIIYILTVASIILSGWSCNKQVSSNIDVFQSNYSFEETVAQLQNTLQAEDIQVFSAINHTKEAQKAGLQLRPTTVLIVGNPKAGTAWMQENQMSAVELPLKILITEDEQGKVSVSYKKSASLVKDFDLKNTAENTAKIDKKMADIISMAIN